MTPSGANPRPLVAAGGLLAVLAAGAAPAPPVRFTEQATAAGLSFRTTYGEPGQSRYILETTGTGAAFLDFDNDGDLDAFLANGSTLAESGDGPRARCALFRNVGGGRFEDVTEKAGLGRAGWGQGAAAADYDNDGFVDLYLTFWGGNVLFHNEGNGTFRDDTARAGVAVGGWSTSAAFADYDRDGDLDLYVARYVAFDPKTAPLPGSGPNCRYRGLAVMCGPRGLAGEQDVLFRNEGHGAFTDVTAAAGALDAARLRGLGVAWGDYDDDGWPDLFVANDAHPNLLFHNEGDGRFRERALDAGVAYDEDGRERAGMGTDFGDYDNDGRLDLVITNFQGEPNSLYLNQGDGTFLETTWASGIGEPTVRSLGWATAFVDLDRDGWLDLFFVNGHVYPEIEGRGLDERYAQRSAVFLNRGDRTFAEATGAAGAAMAVPRAGRGAAFGDYDNDGDVDVLVANVNGAPSLLRNEAAGPRHWLSVRLVGRRSNRDALGARITAQLADGSVRVREVHGGGSYLSQNDPRAHFGLGAAARVRRLSIRWPSGARQDFDDVAADRFLVVDEQAGLRASGRP
jgi:hypothetical protein